jgi:hypothetical protein
MELDIAGVIKDFGFPIIAAFGMGYFIFFIWKWVTETIDPVIGETMVTLIKLVDRIRMLDNDMIRMNMKLAMVLEHKTLIDATLDVEKKDELDALISKYQSRSQVFNSTGKADDLKPEPKPEPVVEEPKVEEETKPKTTFSKADLDKIKKDLK